MFCCSLFSRKKFCPLIDAPLLLVSAQINLCELQLVVRQINADIQSKEQSDGFDQCTDVSAGPALNMANNTKPVSQL